MRSSSPGARPGYARRNISDMAKHALFFSFMVDHPLLVAQFPLFTDRDKALKAVMGALHDMEPGDSFEAWNRAFTCTWAYGDPRRPVMTWPDPEPGEPQYWAQRADEHDRLLAEQAEAEHEADYFTDKAAEL